MRRAWVSAVVLLALAGCGSSTKHPTSSAQATSTSAAAAAASPSAGSAQAATPAPGPVRYSPAKRRYLAHFHPNCKQVGSVGAAIAKRLQTLLAQLRRGDHSSQAQIAAFFHRLALAFANGLAGVRRFGAPPDPDAADARRYLAANEVVVLALQRLGDAVQTGDATAVAPAVRVFVEATDVAQRNARAYGFPQCGPPPAATAPSQPAVSATPSLPAI